MESYRHPYRLIKSSWGIAIDIDCSFTTITDYEYKEDCTNLLNTGLWFYNKCTTITKEEEKYLIEGLLSISTSIVNHSKHASNTLIIINSVLFNPTDFQIEGLKAAIIEWSSKIFNFELPDIKTKFLKESNQYYFDFSALSPQSPTQ